MKKEDGSRKVNASMYRSLVGSIFYISLQLDLALCSLLLFSLATCKNQVRIILELQKELWDTCRERRIMEFNLYVVVADPKLIGYTNMIGQVVLMIWWVLLDMFFSLCSGISYSVFKEAKDYCTIFCRISIVWGSI